MSARALIVGHLTTFGDLEVLDEAMELLGRCGIQFDVASYYAHVSASCPDWLQPDAVIPERYTHLIVCCGPFSKFILAAARFDFNRYRHCVRIGFNLTMLDPVNEFNPFDVVIGRDSNEWAYPDLSVLQSVPRRPVVGLCLSESQAEYPEGQRQHARAAQLLKSLIERNGLAAVVLDTEYPRTANAAGLGTAAEFESICARLDVMLTNRLHGTVLSLKNGVPVIAIDSISGGNKVSRQCRAIGWPEVFAAESVSEQALDKALQRCLLPAARVQATEVAFAAQQTWSHIDAEFQQAIRSVPRGEIVEVSRPHQSLAGKVREGLRWRLRRILRPIGERIANAV
jgi:hypothetical protein